MNTALLALITARLTKFIHRHDIPIESAQMDNNNNITPKEESFATCTLRMLEEETMCDVTLVAGEAKEEIRAHKFILIRSSEVFQVMFSSSFSESNGRVEIPDIEPDILRIFLKYLYSGRLENLEWKTMISLLYIAEKYVVRSLSYKCDEFLQKNLRTENFFIILNQATLYDMKGLLRQCLLYSSIYGKTFIDSEEFLSLTSDSIQALLKSEYFCADEDMIYIQCVKWAKGQCKKDSLETSPENLRKSLGPILNLIRFNHMKVKAFSTLVSTQDILNPAEKIALFQLIGSKEEEYKKYNLCTAPPKKVLRRFDILSPRSEVTQNDIYDFYGHRDSIILNWNKEVELPIILVLIPTKGERNEFSGFVNLCIREAGANIIHEQRCSVVQGTEEYLGVLYLHPIVTLKAQTSYIFSVHFEGKILCINKGKGADEKFLFAGFKLSLQKGKIEKHGFGGQTLNFSTFLGAESSFYGMYIV